jgi:hypothetical protein
VATRHPGKIGELLNVTGFSSAYDFSFLATQDVIGRGAPLGKLAFVFGEAKRYYPNPSSMCAGIDNYGLRTFLSVAAEPKLERMKLALGLLLTVDRIPMLYSGDEVGCWYGDKEVGALFEPGNQNPGFRAHVQRLLALRAKERVLRRGDFQEVASTDAVYAFLRSEGERRVLVALNNSQQTAPLRCAVEGVPWRQLELRHLLGDRTIKRGDDETPVHLGPLQLRVMSVADVGPAAR